MTHPTDETVTETVTLVDVRLNAYRQWLVDRTAWLRKERHNGGNLEYLLRKEEETAYCLKKFDEIVATDAVDLDEVKADVLDAFAEALRRG